MIERLAQERASSAINDKYQERAKESRKRVAKSEMDVEIRDEVSEFGTQANVKGIKQDFETRSIMA